jgi:hypothetical protein
LAICWPSTLPLLPLQDQAFDVDGNRLSPVKSAKEAERFDIYEF